MRDSMLLVLAKTAGDLNPEEEEARLLGGGEKHLWKRRSSQTRRKVRLRVEYLRFKKEKATKSISGDELRVRARVRVRNRIPYLIKAEVPSVPYFGSARVITVKITHNLPLGTLAIHRGAKTSSIANTYLPIPFYLEQYHRHVLHHSSSQWQSP